LNLKQLILFGSGLALLVIAIAAGVLLSGGDSGDDDATVETERPLGPGFVWVDGEWISPSPTYIVETDASVIRINGRLVRRITRLESDEEAVNNQPEGSLGELLETVALHYNETTGATAERPDAQSLAEVTQYAESLPGATTVSFTEPALSITDETGQTGYVILQRPDPLTESQNVRVLQAVTTRWKASLKAGDALLFSGDVTLEVPAAQAVDFLNALVAVFDLPEAEREPAMLDLVGEEQMAAALVEDGRPPPALTDRLIELTPADQPSLVAVPREDGAAADQTRTPASNKAYIFQPIEVEGPDWCFPDPLIEAALRNGYQVIHLRGKASTLDAAVASSERGGIFYVCGHWHAMEPMATRADAMAKTVAYRETFGLDNEDIYPIVSIHTRTVDRMPVPQYYIGAGNGFYEKMWRSAESIVVLSQCYGADLAAGFEAREFLAIDGQCFSVESEREVESAFFAQLGGSLEGQERTVGASFDSALSGAGWVLQGPGGGDTVLSPAVLESGPLDPVPSASEAPITGRVTFDSPMYQAEAALENIVRVSGCGALVSAARWADAQTLVFEFTTGQDPEAVDTSGPLTITVDAAWAASAGSPWVRLNGNREDFSWSLECGE